MASADGLDPQFKRKDRQEDSRISPRAKRPRYVSYACNECKRRKVKCDGELPCRRCIASEVECSYDRRNVTTASLPIEPVSTSAFEEVKLQLNAVVAQVADLQAKLEAMMSGSTIPGDDELATPAFQPPADTVLPEFRGPTSPEFTFEIANETLNSLGINCSRKSQPSQSQSLEGTILQSLSSRSTLWKISQPDATKYIEIYSTAIGSMYPIADNLAYKTKRLFNEQSLNQILSVETQIMKMQLAIGMVIEVGPCDLAQELVDGVTGLCDDLEGIDGVRILVLTALFHYSMDQELKASKYSCLASRRCLEMGFHRADATKEKDVLRVFWSAYTLDRRCSLGLGVPFVIQDNLIDPALIRLEFDHDYLRCMISFAKLSGKAWQMSSDFGRGLDVEEIDYLDYQVSQWRKQIPPSLQYSNRQYLSVVLLVRSNQLRNLIYRPILQSISRTKSYPAHTLTALNLAKESLQVFADLDATGLLQKHAIFFQHFIVSSLGNLLLIVVHATEHWSEIREMFQVGLMLVKKLSISGSRWWNRIKGLEDLEERVSITRRLTQEDDSNMLFDSQIDDFAGLFNLDYADDFLE